MNIFITGAKGFLGKNLSLALKEKHNLLTPTHNELELLNESAVEGFFLHNKIDVVIHCANVGATRKTDNLPQIVGNNLRMFLNLAKQEKYFKKMLFFGSGAEFDKREDLVKISEDYKSANLPEGDYGFSKYLCSHFIRESEKIVNLRIFGVYGKHDDYENRFISNAIARAVLGLPIVIFQDQLMSFVYADDLVKIVEHFINAPAKEKFYHIASPAPHRLTEIAEKIKTISGKNLEIIVKLPGLAKEYTCDNNRLVSEIGEFEFTNLDESLQDLYIWYSNNQSALDITKLK